MRSIKHVQHTHESLLLMPRIETVMIFSIDMKKEKEKLMNCKQNIFCQHGVSYFLSLNLQHYLVIRIHIAKLLFPLLYVICFQPFLNY